MGPAVLSIFEISLQMMETFLEGCEFVCGQMPVSAWADAFGSVGKCRLVSFPAIDMFAGCGAFLRRMSWHCGGMGVWL